jgi:hypothetical protein
MKSLLPRRWRLSVHPGFRLTEAFLKWHSGTIYGA